jgi:hypothetical protein
MAGSYKLNMNDTETLIETLFTAMQTEISETDFFHDKAFLCLLQLLLIVSKNINRKEWFKKTRAKLHKLINVTDLKLCECYWQQIKT